ncbi:MAG: tetratricopeptide repeat protein [Bacteroidia bacterium]|nr:tetratricopeptide repeat protein [Bacteroidia bacterium]
MKLFGFTRDKPFNITDEDREWTESSFKWLLDVYGYPAFGGDQVRFSPDYFPRYSETDARQIEHLLDDLCAILQLDRTRVSFELFEDMRDAVGIPFATEGSATDTALETSSGHYKILVAKSIIKRPGKLLANLIHEFIHIRLQEDKLPYDTGDDTDLFVYIAAVYFGFGVILVQNLTDSGRKNNGLWETKWHYVSEMPQEVLLFALAVYLRIAGKNQAEWTNDFPTDMAKSLAQAGELLKKEPGEILKENFLRYIRTTEVLMRTMEANQFDACAELGQKLLFLADDNAKRSSVYNNLGYAYQRTGEFSASLEYFAKAQELDPAFAYPYDNMGYSLIRMGKLEEGKKHIDLARATGNNHEGYTNRNLALYYEQKGDSLKAEELYLEALDHSNGQVDLLEFHYAQFLIGQTRAEEARQFLDIALERGEPEAIIFNESIKE